MFRGVGGDLFRTSRGLPETVVVESAEHGSLADGTRRSLGFTGLRDLLVDPLMRSLGVVEGDVLLQNVLNLTGPHLLLTIQVTHYLSAIHMKGAGLPDRFLFVSLRNQLGRV